MDDARGGVALLRPKTAPQGIAGRTRGEDARAVGSRPWSNKLFQVGTATKSPAAVQPLASVASSPNPGAANGGGGDHVDPRARVDARLALRHAPRPLSYLGIGPLPSSASPPASVWRPPSSSAALTPSAGATDATVNGTSIAASAPGQRHSLQAPLAGEGDHRHALQASTRWRRRPSPRFASPHVLTKATAATLCNPLPFGPRAPPPHPARPREARRSTATPTHIERRVPGPLSTSPRIFTADGGADRHS